MRREALKIIAALLVASTLAGCGFRLRGQADLPFDSAYIDAPASLPITEQLRRSIEDAGKKVTTKREDAQVVVRLTGGSRHKSILSLTGAGRVREYRLEYRVAMSAQTPDGKELLPPSEIQLIRDMAYDDTQVLAKQAEETELYDGMVQDALRAILLRLRFVKLEPR